MKVQNITDVEGFFKVVDSCKGWKTGSECPWQDSGADGQRCRTDSGMH